MTTVAVTLAEAQANLREAERAAAKESRRRDEEAYRGAIAGGRQFKNEFESLKRQFRATEGEVLQARGKLAVANDQISRHFAAKPNILDFPTPEEEASWERKKNKLVAERDRIGKELEPKSTACEQLRMSAVEMGRKLEHHQWVIKNLQEKLLDPRFPHGPRGGVSSVQAGGISGLKGF